MAFIFLEGLVAQEIPPIKHYKSQIAFAGNQNWMISQDQKGALFIANNKGLLQFRGTDWKLNTSPNQSIVRSVKVIDEKICVGSYMDFGFWERYPNGELHYTSIANQLNVTILEDELMTFESNWINEMRSKKSNPIKTSAFRLRTFEGFKFLDQFWYDLKGISNYPIVCSLEEWGLWVVVYHNLHLRRINPS